MTLAALIRKRYTGSIATAIPAISATQPKGEAATIARIATVAVANPEGEKTGPDLPLLAASIEYHALIERLMCTEEERQRYHELANRRSPEHILGDLPALRAVVAHQQGAQYP